MKNEYNFYSLKSDQKFRNETCFSEVASRFEVLSFFLSFFFLQFFLNKWPDPFFPAIQKKGESGGLIYSKATKVTIWVFHTIYRSFTDTTDLTQMDVIISHFMKK